MAEPTIEEIREWLKGEKIELFGGPKWRENPDLPHWMKKSNEEYEKRKAIIDALLSMLAEREKGGVSEEESIDLIHWIESWRRLCGQKESNCGFCQMTKTGGKSVV